MTYEATIILANGNEVSLTTWQKMMHLEVGSNQLSVHFSIGEKNIFNKCKVSGLLLQLMDRVREEWKKALNVNSLDRTLEEQKKLLSQGYRAAKKSTHVLGLAVDLDTTSNEETNRLVRTIEKVSKDMGIKVRIGWEEYKKDGYTFVHLDVGPEYFGKNKPYHLMSFPEPWAMEARW